MRVIRRVFIFAYALLQCPGLALSQAKADAARGASKAAVCVACHGSPTAVPPPGMPSLGGQQPDFTVLQLILIREGLRDVPEMRGMLKGFSDGDLSDVAAFFAAQAIAPATTSVDPKLHAQGAGIAKDRGCGSCHFGTYHGQQQIPRVANQREDYLVMSLKAYRDNRRTGIDTSMNAAMYKVSDDEIRALAHFLAHHKPAAK